MYNYYVVFDLNSSLIENGGQSIAFVKTDYTILNGGLTTGAICFIIFILIIVAGGVIGCVVVYQRKSLKRDAVLVKKKTVADPNTS